MISGLLSIRNGRTASAPILNYASTHSYMVLRQKTNERITLRVR